MKKKLIKKKAPPPKEVKHVLHELLAVKNYQKFNFCSENELAACAMVAAQVKHEFRTDIEEIVEWLFFSLSIYVPQMIVRSKTEGNLYLPNRPWGNFTRWKGKTNKLASPRWELQLIIERDRRRWLMPILQVLIDHGPKLYQHFNPIFLKSINMHLYQNCFRFNF